MCGKCLDGYETASDEEVAEANEPCVQLQTASAGTQSCRYLIMSTYSIDVWIVRIAAERGPGGPKIKINGVKRNPNLHLSETELYTEEEPEHGPLYLTPLEQPILEQQPAELDAEQQDTTTQAIEGPEATQQEDPTQPAVVQDTRQDESAVPTIADPTMQEPMQEQPGLVQQHPVEHEPPVTIDQEVIDVSVDALGYPDVTPEQGPISDPPESAGCPLNSQPTASGQCECVPGYDEGGSRCVLAHMATAAEAAATATSAAFDILNAHHQVPSHSA